MSGRVSIIIRCLNEEAHIGRLLSGIERQTYAADEVIVVDSGSTDATLAIASRFNTTIVEIAPEEFSFGRALNVGIGASSGDFAVLASAHVYPIYDTWLERLIEPLAADANTAVTYGRQTTPPNGRFSESRLMQQWFPAESVDSQDHPFHNNANSAIRRAIWAELPYDEELTGLEDLDWGKRALDRGYSIAYVAEAPIVHVHDESFAQIQNRYRREAIAHRRIFAEQRMSATSAARLAIANIAGDMGAAARERRLLSEGTGIIGFRTAQFLGTWKGFAQEGPLTRTLKHRFYYPADRSSRPTELSGQIGNPLEYDDVPVSKESQQ